MSEGLRGPFPGSQSVNGSVYLAKRERVVSKEPSIRDNCPWPRVESNAWATELLEVYVGHLYGVFQVIKKNDQDKRGGTE